MKYHTDIMKLLNGFMMIYVFRLLFLVLCRNSDQSEKSESIWPPVPSVEVILMLRTSGLKLCSVEDVDISVTQKELLTTCLPESIAKKSNEKGTRQPRCYSHSHVVLPQE